MRIAAPVLAAVLALSSGIAIANKVDVDERRPDGSTSLLWAAFEGDVTEAARLLKAGADVDAVNNYGINSLLLAADISNTALIQLLLKHGADAGPPTPTTRPRCTWWRVRGMSKPRSCWSRPAPKWMHAKRWATRRR